MTCGECGRRTRDVTDGRCWRCHQIEEMTLAEQTSRRLLLDDSIHPLDRGLRAVREWNAAAYERAGLPNPHEP